MNRITRAILPPILILALLASCARKGEEKTVAFTPERPTPADRITVRYTPGLSPSPLRSGSAVFRFTLVDKEGGLLAGEVPMERRGPAWEAALAPVELTPKEPVLLVCAFVDPTDPEVVDNNRGDPWVLLFHEGETPVAGARYQYYRLLAGEERLTDVVRVPRDRARALEELEKSVEERPESAEARFVRWARVLEKEEPDKARADSLLAAARAEADQFFMNQENWTEPPPATEGALDLYALIGGETLRDSLTDALIARFPRTRFASSVLYRRVMEEEDRGRFAREMERFAREHPDAKEAEEARTYAIYLYLRYLGERENARALIHEGKPVERFVLSLYAETLLDEGELLDEAEETLLRAIREEEGASPSAGEGLSPAEWERNRRETLASLLHLLARVRETRGDDAGAAEALGRALRDLPEQATPDMLLRAARIRSRTGDTEGALEAYDLLARAARPSGEATEEWRALWEAEGEGDFDAHAARLREEGRAEAMARLDRRALRWPVPEIRFLDTGGDTLTLAGFLGRPVLIDFWATWCGPCRRSLPHVETIYETRKEAGDDLIVLPINVWERTADEERLAGVREKWGELGLTMPYYLDLDPGEGVKTAAELFAVPAIPTTCLIGRDGTILFKIVGFDEEKGDEEMRLKIDYALAR
ncbi:MAG: TlpA family protein disulfide reductase [Candidatus Eisenbacteria bacterium]|nr:TlpA family protein disulfide reductase [Candidatus Eisenbacteria bacterium]